MRQPAASLPGRTNPIELLRSVTVVIFVLCFFPLTSCSSAGSGPTPPSPAASTFVYQCEGGLRLLTKIGKDRITLLLPEGPTTLPQGISASGVRYSNGQITFWTKGENAMLFEQAGQEEHRKCQVDRAESVWEDARLRGVGFRATGNEPGWYLEIGEGSQILFVTDYGERKIKTPAPRPIVEVDSGITAYHATGGAHALHIEIQKRPCQDSMSGQMFESSVMIELDGTRYQGCGKALN